MKRLLIVLTLGISATFPAIQASDWMPAVARTIGEASGTAVSRTSTTTTTVQVAEVTTGEKVFKQWCIHCHGEDNSGPGTLRLLWDKGKEKSLLTGRDDLGSEYIRVVVRRGLDEMPSFRITEISDVELNALVEFLSR